MSDYQNKKILFLAGDRLTKKLVEEAKDHGFKTIVANFYPPEKAPAKLVADEQENISIMDYPAMKKLIEEKHVDGIFTAFTDSHLGIYNELCTQNHLPCYITKEQIDLTANKVKFKNLCRKFGVPTVKQFALDKELCPQDIAKLEYPLMIKPADSSGSRGCSVCRNEGELKEKVAYALEFSPSQTIIVEKYMDPFTTSDINICYMFNRGEAKLAFLADRYTNSEQKEYAPLTACINSPSVYIHEILKTDFDVKIKAMFKSIGVQDGSMFIQAFYDNEGLHVYEMGYRLGGGAEVLPTRVEYGVDARFAFLRYAVSGIAFDGQPFEQVSPLYKKHYCNLHFLLSTGIITRIEGLEEAQKLPGLIEILQTAVVGDEIKSNGTLAQVFLRIYFSADSRDEIKKTMDYLGNLIKVYDQNGNNMLMHVTNSKDID